MANPEHVKILGQGIDAWNQWREENPRIKPDLHGAELSNRKLSYGKFSWTDFTQANLTGASLFKAKLMLTQFWHAKLDHADLGSADLMAASFANTSAIAADFSQAILASADIGNSNLSNARLHNTFLVRVNFTDTILTGSDFTDAILEKAVFSQTTLSTAKGLETCKHSGPSAIDIATLSQPGSLPLSFLRGCGLPEAFIDYLPSLIGQAIQLNSCFISYSHKDKEFAQRLHADLQDNGIRCWFAPEDIQGGKKIHEQIDQAIKIYDRLLLILSEHSMDSEWVKTEIANARQKELDTGKRVLFSLRLVDIAEIRAWKAFDADTGKDSAREIREYFIPDFSNWKDHDAYQHSFERLLRDLKPQD